MNLTNQQIWMMANIGPGETIGVKYVLNARKIGHSFHVWKRRRGRKRPGSGALRNFVGHHTHFLSTFFTFLSFSLLLPDTFVATTQLSHYSVADLPSADALRPAPAVAARLNASGSEDSHRGQTGVE
jgi:hypothetical protein